MEKSEKEIVILNLVRRSLKDKLLMVEDQIKNLTQTNPMTKVNYQLLNTKLYFQIPHEIQIDARRKIQTAVDSILNGEKN